MKKISEKINQITSSKSTVISTYKITDNSVQAELRLSAEWTISYPVDTIHYPKDINPDRPNSKLWADIKINAIKMTINGCMIISASNPDSGDFSASIPCKRDDSSNEDIVLGFNARYLLENLQSYPNSDSILDFTSAIGPCLLNDHAIVMPSRV